MDIGPSSPIYSNRGHFLIILMSSEPQQVKGSRLHERRPYND